MIKLLKIEWMKIKDYTTFKVLALLYFLSIIGITYIGYRINLNINKATENMAGAILGNPFNFPELWNTTAFFVSLIFFIPGLFIINLMSNEYNFRTHRQNIIDGMSRTGFIKVKILLCFFTSVFATISVFVAAIIIGLINKSTINFDQIEYLGYFFIQTFAYTLFALTLTMFIRRSGLALGIYFLYAMILENLITGLINIKLAPVGYFFPLECVDKLLDVPFAKQQVKDTLKLPAKYYLLLAAGLYIILYLTVTFRRYKKVDL